MYLEESCLGGSQSKKSLKGAGSRDGLDLCRHALVHMRVFGHNSLASYWLQFENPTPAYI
jgi:hypothetical protein